MLRVLPSNTAWKHDRLPGDCVLATIRDLRFEVDDGEDKFGKEDECWEVGGCFFFLVTPSVTTESSAIWFKRSPWRRGPCRRPQKMITLLEKKMAQKKSSLYGDTRTTRVPAVLRRKAWEDPGARKGGKISPNGSTKPGG